MRALSGNISKLCKTDLPSYARRTLTTLAIETSCDDTSVAVLQQVGDSQASLPFHASVTSDNRIYRGIHPIQAHISHQKHLACLIRDAVKTLVLAHHPPDFITVTRGPGMRASLATGLDTAKGLAVAWQIPLLAVHHMQAHALTPRLINALNARSNAPPTRPSPDFPYLTLLVTGGHTQLLHSTGVCHHQILADTTDKPVGAMLDRCARDILPDAAINAASDVSYASLLESFAFGTNSVDSYERYSSSDTIWPFTRPYTNPGPGGKASHDHEFTYSGIGTQVSQFLQQNPGMTDDERHSLARDMMRCAFEHLASRVLIAIEKHPVKCVVVSGGVASNHYLRHVLRRALDKHEHTQVDLVFPPPRFCTDNAAMIAWTGIEMWHLGWESDLDVTPLQKWSIDPTAKDGGVLGVGHWARHGRSKVS